ncbi:hypothetical protein BDP27DRAFT_1364993 [Rhodocollybia butyracea]|uniref:DUF6535 domain-containing protein n=1 Tax=Rhodocollybia butyracea TaxID=206335 RepID=A0A9P5U607_9AGAR|nr:hypothetical protein BDP27DRAFT_1364993 [Rhodocollybia butyracea]
MEVLSADAETHQFRMEPTLDDHSKDSASQKYKGFGDYVQQVNSTGQLSYPAAGTLTLAQTIAANGPTKLGYVGGVEHGHSPSSTHVSDTAKHNLSNHIELSAHNGRDRDRDAGDGDDRGNANDYLASVANSRLSVIFILGTLLSVVTGTLLGSFLPPDPAAALKSALLALIQWQHDAPAITKYHATTWADTLWSLSLTLSLSSALLGVLAKQWIRQCCLSPTQRFRIHLFRYTDSEKR